MRFDLAAVLGWRLSGVGGDDVSAARAAKERAQRYLAEQTLMVRSGELVAKDDVIEEWSSRAAAMRASLVALPTRPEFAGVAQELESAVRAVLEELADGNDEPPAPPARKRKAKRTRSKPAKRTGIVPVRGG